MTIFPKWLLNTDKIPNPKGPFPKMLKKSLATVVWMTCMDDLGFYVLFNSISVTGYVRVIMMELFLRFERFLPPLPPPTSSGGIKPGMDNLPFHILSNSILIIYSPPRSSGESIQGWITCHFTFFQTVFRSYQDDEGMMMKGCVKLNTVYD